MTDADRTLVTGFLDFEGFPCNPSAVLAQRSGRRYELIEVAYAAVDDFIESLAASSFDRLLLTGVAANATRLRVERVARNAIDGRPDVQQAIRGPGPIDPLGPAMLIGTLWPDSIFSRESEFCCPSDDAGCYLCNYIYYRALQMFPTKRVGFLHVAPDDAMPIERQLSAIDELLTEAEAWRAPTNIG